LRDEIKKIRKKLREHRTLYMANEEAVKQHLILPTLSALGWKVDDPKEVRPEEKTEEGRADYALIKDGRIVAFLEAKNLSVNPVKAVTQLAKYCFDRGVEVGIVSNGRFWIIVKAFEPGKDIRDRIVTRVDVEEEPLDRIILKLSCISKEKIERILEMCEALNKIESGVKTLKSLGISEGEIANYVLSLPLRGAFPPEDVHPSEKVKGVYILDFNWKYLPVPDGTLKGALITLMEYLKEKEEEEREKKILEKAIAEIKTKHIPNEKIIFLIKGIEKEKGIKVLISL